MIPQYVKCAGAKLGDIIIMEAMSVSLAGLSSEGERFLKNGHVLIFLFTPAFYWKTKFNFTVCLKNIEMLLDVFRVKYIQA